ncbi:hypothetical protein [Acetoanaerobium sticklandii]|uniref:hypothetical protein n=1 Tax=Acetoanaerobium sticklandii TaxID=1511 RepID=UPI003A8EE1D0
MYKKIMVFGMVLLIMLCTPLPSSAVTYGGIYHYPPFKVENLIDSAKTHFNSSYYIVLKSTYDSTDVNKPNIVIVQSSKPLLMRKNSVSTGNSCLLNASPNNNIVYYIYYGDNKSTDSFYEKYSFLSKIDSAAVGREIILSPFLNNSDNVIYSNYSLVYDDGTILNDVNAQGFDGRITLPANDGYKDNGTTFTFWHWYQLPTGVDSSDVKIDPYIDDSKDTYHSASVTLHQKIPNTSKWNLNINLTVRDYGPHTYKVVFKQISTGEILGTLTRTFEALEGFIDENGDGLDDRTGQPPYDPLEPPDGSATPEWDGTIVGFFKYLIDNVKYYNEMLVSGVQTTINSIGKVPQMLGEVINLPPEIMALFTFGIIISILLRVLGR